MSVLYLTLSRPEDESDVLPIRFALDDNPMVAKWKRLLLENIKVEPNLAQGHLEKNFCFLGFPGSDRNQEFLLRSLEQSILRFNERIQLRGLSADWIIPRVSDIFRNGSDERQSLNELHHFFEVGSGPVESRSELFASADQTMHFCLRQFNNICHELEAFLRSKMRVERGETALVNLVGSFLRAPREEFDFSNYARPKKKHKFGQLQVHYAQTGKTLYEVFEDSDEHVEESGISEHEYLSGEFVVDFSAETPDSDWDDFLSRFEKWRLEHHPDRQPLGRIPIGYMTNEELLEMEHSQFVQKLTEYSNLLKISFEECDDPAGRVYEYQWTDPAYMDRQQSILG